VCKYKLDKQIAQQSRAFFNGLSDVIDPKCMFPNSGSLGGSMTESVGLRMFDQHELQQLIGGEETLIDMDDLRVHAVVSGFPNDKTIRLFWKVVKGFNQEERRALLRFVTSCSRPPL
jgi:ubiquitin-protein ligase E3 C